MRGRERCDEILRLIDEALDEIGPTPVPSRPVATEPAGPRPSGPTRRWPW